MAAVRAIAISLLMMVFQLGTAVSFERNGRIGLDFGYECDPELELYQEDHPEEFLGHKYVCNLAKNLKCKLFPRDIFWDDLLNDRMRTSKENNVSSSASAEEIMKIIAEETYNISSNNTFWACVCSDPASRYFSFGKAKYWKSFIDQALDMGCDLERVIEEASELESKCSLNLGDSCDSDEICPPNSGCVLQAGASNTSICMCEEGFARVQNACLNCAFTRNLDLYSSSIDPAISCSNCNQYNFILSAFSFIILSFVCYYLLLGLLAEEQHHLDAFLDEFSPSNHVVITSGVY